MTMLRVSEGRSVQFPMVRHAAEIGWRPLPPEEVESLRQGRANMLFRDVLEDKLREFNLWMSEAVARSVVDTIDALPATIDGNRQVLSWLRGERQVYDDSEQRHRPVRVIDFDTPSANDMVVTWEWRIEPVARKGNRADVVFVVNGIPVAIVEHKNPADGKALDRAVTQLRRYEVETPELLAAPQLFNVTHLLDYWYGVTWNPSRRHMARWKQTPDEEYRFAVQAFFEPTDFLRTLQHWILFYIKDGESTKSVLREHQRRAVDRIVERCADPSKTRGLVWHTQGSGKTFTLLTAARLILADQARSENATVILVVDRTELEGQLRDWVSRLVQEMEASDIPVRRADTKRELQELLDADFRGLIISMIHKFDEIRKDSSTRSSIYVFIDEAHRSVARDLGTYLMAALPNATILGFTGTPVANVSGGRASTFQIFGVQDESGSLDRYSIRESIEDGTTLPIRYLMAPSAMSLPAERLDEEFFALTEAEDVTEIEDVNRVLDRAVGIRAFLGADDRIEQVAEFVAEHFKTNVHPLGLKAFLVAVDREACAKYKVALDRHLPPQWSQAVYSSNPSDVVERPLVAELQLSDTQEQDARRAFAKVGQDPQILIVTDKLLTGYDAEVLFAMYLDKPMRDHVLLQALARVNRPYVDEEGIPKRVGLVVDFVGVLREIRRALRFDSAEIEGAIETLDTLMADILRRLPEAADRYLAVADDLSADGQLENVVYGRFLDPEVRKTFFDEYREIQALWEILSPDAQLRDHVTTYKRLSQLYAIVRNAYADSSLYLVDLEHKTRRLVEQNAIQTGLGQLDKEVTFDTATIGALRRGEGSPEGKVFNLLRAFHSAAESNPADAVILRGLSERVDRVIQQLEDRKMTGMAALDEMSALAAERERLDGVARELGLSPIATAVYAGLDGDEALVRFGIAPAAIAREVEALLQRYPNWVENADEQRLLRRDLYRPLVERDVAPAVRAAIVAQIISIIDETLNG